MVCANLGRFDQKSAQSILVEIHCKFNENLIGAFQSNGDSLLITNGLSWFVRFDFDCGRLISGARWRADMYAFSYAGRWVGGRVVGACLQFPGVPGVLRSSWSSSGFLAFCGVPGVPWSSWSSLDFLEPPWSFQNSLEFLEFPWVPGVPWSSWSSVKFLESPGARGVP